MSDGPSPNLRWSEMACKDSARTPYPAEWRRTRAVSLAFAFEAVRCEYGLPIAILSGYRTPAHNKSIPGASKNSQHMQGRALDLKPLKGKPLRPLIEAVQAVARRGDTDLRGVGLYETFVHIDVRQSEHVVTWPGSSLRKQADA